MVKSLLQGSNTKTPYISQRAYCWPHLTQACRARIYRKSELPQSKSYNRMFKLVDCHQNSSIKIISGNHLYFRLIQIEKIWVNIDQQRISQLVFLQNIIHKGCHKISRLWRIIITEKYKMYHKLPNWASILIKILSKSRMAHKI